MFRDDQAEYVVNKFYLLFLTFPGYPPFYMGSEQLAIEENSQSSTAGQD